MAWADVDTARLAQAIGGRTEVRAFAQRPAILETAEEGGRRGGEGLGADADTAFLAQGFAAGRLFGPDSSSLDVLVSSIHARELGLEPGRQVRLLLANAEGEMASVFVCGVYGTGLQEIPGRRSMSSAACTISSS